MELKDKIINKITEKLKKGEEISPFLMLSNDISRVNIWTKNIIQEVFSHFNVNANNLHMIEMWEDKIKIEEARRLLEKSFQKPNNQFQIFLIEDISRLTIGSSNSLLKFFEEPKEWNIIFLTNSWENWVLDTILSRVQIHRFENTIISEKDNFFYNLIDEFRKKKSPSLPSYFFKEKLEKNDYIKFLKTIIIYWKENFVFEDFLDKIVDDINLIEKNNVLPKYIVDKHILNIKNSI